MNASLERRQERWRTLIAESLLSRRLLLASNRAPITLYRNKSGGVTERRGAGGLVSAVDAMLTSVSNACWIAAPSNDIERALAVEGAPADQGDRPYQVLFADVAPDEYQLYYDKVSNEILWYLHHYLFSPAYSPVYSDDFVAAWAGYERVNRSIAERVLASLQEDDKAVVMIQDYHLYLVPGLVREEAPSALIAFFHHIPWCSADYYRLLPSPYREEILKSLLACDTVGFHTWRYADNFANCCDSVLETKIDRRRRSVTLADRQTMVRAYPISVSSASLIDEAASQEVRGELPSLDPGQDVKLLLRVDRAELSKNLLRGFEAYELFLRRHPDWLGKVRFLALTYPTRENVDEYRTYAQLVKRKVKEINAAFGTPSWQPIELKMEDNYKRSLAAMTACDVLLANPIFDGMNLVAKETAIVNRKDAVIILSETAGASDELRDAVLSVSPFDIEATAKKIAQALTMPLKERRIRARRLRQIVLRNDSLKWLAHQLHDLARADASRDGANRQER